MKIANLTPISKEIPVDLETPVSTFLKLQREGAVFLLESVEKEEQVGRYSFIGLNPCSVLKIMDQKMILDGHEISFQNLDFLEKLRKILFAYQVNSGNETSPFFGGWIGFLGYDVIRFFESVPTHPIADYLIPEGILCLVKDIVVFDHYKHRAKVITSISSQKERAGALKRMDQIVEVINTPLTQNNAKVISQSKGKIPQPNFTKREFERAVEKALEYILAGDIFQVVLSQRYSGKTTESPLDIYRMLRMINPSPYMFYLDFGDFHLIGSSPEALVRLNKRTATLRPIAGTRPRGRTHEEDSQLAEELQHDEKERAEHVMLVDLARNDLGKVCTPHSIKINERMNVEKYSHVMHLVSEVRGELERDFDALDLFKAAFPAGTVTGAPKIRAMEIIEELEKVKRGPYSGAVGYFGLNGDMDMCIAIRTIFYRNGEYFLQAGAGIVADSRPWFEHKETLNKMAGMHQAIKMSEEKGDDIAHR